MIPTFSPDYPYPSRRSVTCARGGMVATSQPVASQIGQSMLARGGNAVDAAIATAAALTVVEPTGCGIGSDSFALVWMQAESDGNGKLFGMNASGCSPAALTRDAARARGLDAMPMYGWLPVTVPGAPASWAALSERFGKLDFGTLLEPAVRLASDGVPISPIISRLWTRAARRFRQVLDQPETAHWFDCFTDGGRAPGPGDVYRNLPLAKTLATLADDHCRSLYSGRLADRIDAFSRETNGFLRGEDMDAFRVEWVDPISVNYRGFDVWEIPPNGIGLVTLASLRMLEAFAGHDRSDPAQVHRQIEALKLAYIDGNTYITDPARMTVGVEALLDDAYLESRRAMIGEEALAPVAGRPEGSETVYLATADADGNMVSFIQSNFHGFGSGVVIPDTGISMQNRGQGFSLDPNHHNALEPRKRTRHTIIPGFLTRDGVALGPFGVMGGVMQPQGHLQVVMNMVDCGLNPQAALDAPRWMWTSGQQVSVEGEFPTAMARHLVDRGHDIQVDLDTTIFGRGQVIVRDPDSGVYHGGCDWRTDSSISVI
ncbi:gamma-glutamyltranspeptidase/glutathione hydrolase [Natronocella acetinitrilica]|uniref:Gamma-glutamyltranspeptidase/glutathione hydrolase n=1 Tax=Natronocella acetinitrilica TaxID=414046 RepID=A0AAE3G940_9GAMM|nr:gamma-glutamyltransferase family protein [Natronocella acetinitrilica]MCP1676738.1 gamma-glutamyltranspeptidase/glutathione hydrolase [Natronocella acetinitrilica]